MPLDKSKLAERRAECACICACIVAETVPAARWRAPVCRAKAKAAARSRATSMNRHENERRPAWLRRKGERFTSNVHWVAETPFAILKAVMGIRQFLLRGLEKVKTEWLWAVTSFNLAKLVREIKKLRAESAQLA